jgi:hypothetical protein
MMINQIEILDKYYPTLVHAFSPGVIGCLIDTGKSRYLSETLNDSGLLGNINTDMKLGEFYDWLYSQICRSYKSEYVYKNAIASKILLGRHSLNTSYMLTEFRVENCKADVVILNGTSTVYEIKSEFDSLDRIQNQISSYKKMFDRVNVIASSSQIEKVKQLFTSEVGLMELTPQITIKTIREPESMRLTVNPEVIFNSLRRNEYTKIIRKVYGYVPEVPNTQIYEACKELFCTLEPQVAHNEMVRVLLQRSNRKVLKEVISDIPNSLIAYLLSSQMSLGRVEKLNVVLEQKLKNILIPIK